MAGIKAESPKIPPQAHVSWPSKGIRLAGDYANLGLGKGCRVVLDGKVTGFSLDEWGGSVDISLKLIRFEKLSESADEGEGEPMTDLVKKLSKLK